MVTSVHLTFTKPTDLTLPISTLKLPIVLTSQHKNLVETQKIQRIYDKINFFSYTLSQSHLVVFLGDSFTTFLCIFSTYGS
jgi:hypothetical protein